MKYLVVFVVWLWFNLKLCWSFMLNSCPNENICFCGFHVLVVSNIFWNTLAWCCNFFTSCSVSKVSAHLTQCEFVRIQWCYKLVHCYCWMFFLCIFSSFNFRFMVSVFFLCCAFGCLCCEELNCTISGWYPDLKCWGQVGTCAPVLGNPLHWAMQNKWDDDSWFL